MISFKVLWIVFSLAICNPAFAAECIDFDGDGWGWDGTNSCFLGVRTEVNQPQAPGAGACLDSDGDGFGWNGVESCDPDGGQQEMATVTNSLIGPCLDDDGDGYGWNGQFSCDPGGNESANNQPMPMVGNQGAECVDDDGDGFGWDGQRTCLVNGSTGSANEGASSGSGENSACGHIDSLSIQDKLAQVNHVVLTAGQSNAAGNKTRYEPERFEEDQMSPRLLVWTHSNRWEIADPKTQLWVSNRFGHFPKAPGLDRYFNHPAFQIGKAILRQGSCSVVAIIPSSASGQSINYWLNDMDGHFSAINSKVSQALGQLLYKNSIDLLWWMQGESDEGTGEDFHLNKIHQLVSNFRARWWFSINTYFLANETGWFPQVNRSIRRLGQDGDQYTDYSRGESRPGDEFTSVQSELPLQVHFDERALRRIGRIVAEKYLGFIGN